MRKLIAGNWKMHGLAAQLPEIDALAGSVHDVPSAAEVLLCVPATLLSRAVEAAAGRIAIGGEDCHSEASGSFTGDISANMLKDAGAMAVIVGHSERRQLHQESDMIAAAKALAAWRSGLSTIICIGESDDQRRHGHALAVCGTQIAGSVPEQLIRSGTVSIAYEPLWAIGTGHVPTAGQITEIHQYVRSRLEALAGPAGADIRILYGGSVSADNAPEILGLGDVGGLLIGGVSLMASDFEAVLRSVPGHGNG